MLSLSKVALGVVTMLALTATMGAAVVTAADGSGYGSSSECAGPGLENAWGQPEAAGNGASYGRSSEVTGPGLQNTWGQSETTGEGAGYGSPSEGAGPGLQNSWGK